MKKQEKIIFKSRSDQDNIILSQWHAADPEHQLADVGFFTEPSLGVQHLTVDNDDETIAFVTVENVARVHIQFNPNGSKLKIAKTLILGMTWLAKTLKERGYKELIFDTKFPSLIKFAQSVLGFIKRDQDYSTRL